MSAPSTPLATPEATPPRPPKPTPPEPVDIRTIPALAWLCEPDQRRWIGWRYEWDAASGKWTKVPYVVGGRGRKARSNDPTTWCDYEIAWKAVRLGIYDGLGLMLLGLPAELLAAIDYDDVRSATGVLITWAQQSIDAVPDCHCEITPSAEGVRLLGYAADIKTIHTRGKHPEGGSFELFANCARFITMSGQVLDPTRTELREIGVQIEALAALLPRRGNGAGDDETDPSDDGQGGAISLGTLRHDVAELILTATENGEPVAHPGAKFKAAVGYLRKRGYSRGASLRLLAEYPDGVAGKFVRRSRLETEFNRAWNKSQTADEREAGNIASQDAAAAQERSKGKQKPPAKLTNGDVPPTPADEPQVGKQASPLPSEDKPNGDATEVRQPPPSGNAAAAAKTKQPDPAAATAAKEEAQRNRLIEVALSRDIAFWHDEDGNAYATVPRKDHKERYRVRSGRFKLLLRQMYGAAYPNLIASKKFGYPIPGGVSDTAMNEALPTLEAIAQRGVTRQPRVRVWRAPGDGTVWIDLGDDSWALIAVRPTGWQIVPQADVPLIRSRGLRALPMPERDPEALGKPRALFNLNPEASVAAATKHLADSNFKIVVAFMLSVFWPRGPYCIMVVNGEQGSAKTTLCWIVGEMTDPNRAPLRKVPRNPEDLMITAQNRRLVPLDNVSHLASDLADTLCGIATGTGAGTREFYTNADEVIFEACNPIMINGIEGLLTRGDFADRSLSILLMAIDDAERRTDEEVKKAAREAAPGVLALLLDAMVTAMRNLPALKLERMPRMADFTRLACAAAPAFGWDSEAVFEAIEDNREAMVTAVLGADVVATTLLNFLAKQSLDLEGYLWLGAATELLKRLRAFAPAAIVKSKAWPKLPHHLSGRITRAAPALRRAGIEVDRSREAGGRLIGFRPASPKAGDKEQSASPASPASSANVSNGLDMTLTMTLNDAQRCEASGREGDDGPEHDAQDQERHGASQGASLKTE